MKIPVIILNYNSSSDCRKCIADLKRQIGVETEIIVVDNCSCEDDQRAVEQLCQENESTSIANTKNCGYNGGNNIGLRYAAGKGYQYALVVNPDMEFPQANYIAALAAKMNEDAEIAVAASDIFHAENYHQNPLKPDGDWRGSLQWLGSFFRPCIKNQTLDFIDNYSESHYCHKVSGCCFMIRISFLQKINFFDEYPFLYCEEAILACQVKQAGMRMLYIAERQAIHRHISQKKGNPVARLKQWRRSRIYYQKNYASDSFPGKITAIFSWGLYIEILIWGYRCKKIVHAIGDLF